MAASPEGRKPSGQSKETVMSIFDRLDRMTSRQVDRTFSVRFQCNPTKATPNGRPVLDPSREGWIGKGVLEEQPRYHSIETGNRDREGNDLRALATGNSFELSVDRVRYPQANAAKQMDRIVLDDARKFNVVSVRRDGLSRLIFVLDEIRT